jgi:hypothetical protein
MAEIASRCISSFESKMEAKEEPLAVPAAQPLLNNEGQSAAEPNDTFEEPKSHQLRALFRKTITLQLRQKATNVIQVSGGG